jgi:excisionase family DNA binding protein
MLYETRNHFPGSLGLWSQELVDRISAKNMGFPLKSLFLSHSREASENGKLWNAVCFVFSERHLRDSNTSGEFVLRFLKSEPQPTYRFREESSVNFCWSRQVDILDLRYQNTTRYKKTIIQRAKKRKMPGQKNTNKDDQPERLTIDVREYAAAAGISRLSVYLAVQRGEIPVVRIGRRILIPKSELQKLSGFVA